MSCQNNNKQVLILKYNSCLSLHITPTSQAKFCCDWSRWISCPSGKQWNRENAHNPWRRTNHNLLTREGVTVYKNYENPREMKTYLHEKVRPARTLIFPVVYHSFVTAVTEFCQPQLFFHIGKVCSAWAVGSCVFFVCKKIQEQVLELLYP